MTLRPVVRYYTECTSECLKQYISIFKLPKNASNKTAATLTQIFYVLRQLLPDAAPSAHYVQILWHYSELCVDTKADAWVVLEMMRRGVVRETDE